MISKLFSTAMCCIIEISKSVENFMQKNGHCVCTNMR